MINIITVWRSLALPVLLGLYLARSTAGFIGPSSNSKTIIGSPLRYKILPQEIPTKSFFSVPSNNARWVKTRTHFSTMTSLSMAMMTAREKLTGKKRLATAMAFLTAWANIAIFTKFKSFATMITGNTLWMAVALSEQRYRDVFFYVSVILSYGTGCAIFRRTDLSLRQKTLPVCCAAVAALFVLADWIHYGTTISTKWIPMMLLATGFGIVNSVGQEVCGTLTFVVTGHITRLMNQVVDRLSKTAGRKRLTESDKLAVLQNSAVCTGFFSGAVWAAFLMSQNLLHRFGTFSLIGLMYGTLWLSHDIKSLGGAWWLRKDKAMCDDVVDNGVICDLEEEDDFVRYEEVAP